jgi:hypothetical protein
VLRVYPRSYERENEKERENGRTLSIGGMNCEMGNAKKTPHFLTAIRVRNDSLYTDMSERTCAIFVGTSYRYSRCH